jgi:5-methylcytosine-specific restriction endonuclease McrA
MTKRNTTQRDRDRARIRATKANCHICGEPIDYTLPWPDPMCFVVDHIKSLHKGGADHIHNKAAAHNKCNSKKRARDFAPIIRRSGALD